MSVSNSNVVYKDIEGHPGYRVTRSGTVWSCWTLVMRGPGLGNMAAIGTSWKQRKPALAGAGYHCVGFGHSGNIRPIAHLVLEAFVGPRPKGMEACHGDGDKANNDISNLRWDTHKNNIADRLRHGTDHKGSKHPAAKLSEKEAAEIRSMYKAGRSPGYIAKIFGVSRSNIIAIGRKRTWKHIP